MAKRFTDTEKWKKNWFLELEPSGKLLWLFILDHCDHAGICEFSPKLFKMFLGFNVSKEVLNDLLKDKIEWKTTTKFIVKSFIEFQYGELNSDNRAHKSVLKLLNDIECDKKISPLLAPTEGATEAPTEGAKDKDKDKDKDMDMDMDKDKDKDKDREAPYPSTTLSDEECENLSSTLGQELFNKLILEYPKEFVEEKILELSAWLINRPKKNRWTRRGLYLGIKKCLKKDFTSQTNKYKSNAQIKQDNMLNLIKKFSEEESCRKF